MRYNIRIMRNFRSIDALFPQIRKQILATLILHSNHSWYLSDLAKHLHKTPSSLQRELAALTQAGILLQTKNGNRTYYKANKECPFFPELLGMLIKTAGLVDVVSDALSPVASKIRLAFIFGSIAKNEDRSDSDVDLLIVGNLNLVDLSKILSGVESRLARAVNPVLYSESEFRDKLQKGNHFLTAVLAEPKLFILGTENDLAGFGNSRTSEETPDVTSRVRRLAHNHQARS